MDVDESLCVFTVYHFTLICLVDMVVWCKLNPIFYLDTSIFLDILVIHPYDMCLIGCLKKLMSLDRVLLRCINYLLMDFSNPCVLHFMSILVNLNHILMGRINLIDWL